MPFPENTPGIDELINLPVGEIALLPVDLLAAMQREIDAAAKQMKAVTARFNTALEVRFATRAAEVRSASGKDAERAVDSVPGLIMANWVEGRVSGEPT